MVVSSFPYTIVTFLKKGLTPPASIKAALLETETAAQILVAKRNREFPLSKHRAANQKLPVKVHVLMSYAAITIGILRVCVLLRTSVHLGLIDYIDTKAKCRHLKKFTCEETLRQVFVRVH